MEKKALLVISFGTSVPETRQKTISAVEKKLAGAFPDRKLYSAWTSNVIIRKLRKMTGEQIDTVEEALERVSGDGMTDVLVQPTVFFRGYEYDGIREVLHTWAPRFGSLRLGSPLVAGEENIAPLVCALRDIFSGMDARDALLLMGHGSDHPADAIYSRIEKAFRDAADCRMTVATVEGGRRLGDVLPLLTEMRPRKVYIAPLMLVAGNHALVDMSGDEPDSWKNILQARGFETECVLRGMGEFVQIQDLYIDHARRAEKVQ